MTVGTDHEHIWNGPWLATTAGAVASCGCCGIPQPIIRPEWGRVAHGVGVPRRLRNANANAESRQTVALSAVLAQRPDEHGTCLVLTGATGVGKSWAAVAGLRLVYEDGTDATALRFAYFPAVCGRLLTPETRVGELNAVKGTGFLVLDDFGVEYVKEGGLIDAFLDEIIWYREAEMMPTIITTNLTTDLLKQRLPARLVDRLRGDWGRIYECPGESLRTDG